MSKEYPWGKGTPKWVRDAAANDSDKSFTVPAGKVWDLKSVTAFLATTATVGSRILTLTITDGTDPVYVAIASANLAASGYITAVYSTNLGDPGDTTVRRRLDNAGAGTIGLNDFLPDMLLPAGYVVRVWDFAAIDAAADDLTVVLHYVEYDA